MCTHKISKSVRAAARPSERIMTPILPGTTPPGSTLQVSMAIWLKCRGEPSLRCVAKKTALCPSGCVLGQPSVGSAVAAPRPQTHAVWPGPLAHTPLRIRRPVASERSQISRGASRAAPSASAGGARPLGCQRGCATTNSFKNEVVACSRFWHLQSSAYLRETNNDLAP